MYLKLLLVAIFLLPALCEAKSAAENELPFCPKTPNCVSTQASQQDQMHYIAPFNIRGATEVAWATLKQALARQRRTVSTRISGNRLHAEATSLIFRFVDDIDMVLDADARLLHIRSASRVGYSDMGVNRERVENLRKVLQKAGVID